LSEAKADKSNWTHLCGDAGEYARDAGKDTDELQGGKRLCYGGLSLIVKVA